MNPVSAAARSFAVSGCLLLALAGASAAEKPRPLSLAEAQRAFRVAPGLRVEIAAAEPQIGRAHV